MRIPAFVNPGAGTAAPVLEALRRDPAVAPTLLDGMEIGPAVERALAGGARALDVIVPHGFRRARRLLGVYAGSGRGLQSAASEAGVDRLLVERCRVELARPRVPVAVDREITTLAPPLEYRLARDRPRVVRPEPGAK